VLRHETRFGMRFGRLAEEAGCTPRHHAYHDLKHAYATGLLLSGAPLFRVSAGWVIAASR